ncbi:spidroin-1-like [Asparagus officinalis]|uniref:spidroin-1-like n=1 Tax=Asparagus officinalis TaxID=4686 RepID=UPI00098E1513|nr:spidroin-1-like [Asparagus officinalis]
MAELGGGDGHEDGRWVALEVGDERGGRLGEEFGAAKGGDELRRGRWGSGGELEAAQVELMGGDGRRLIGVDGCGGDGLNKKRWRERKMGGPPLPLFPDLLPPLSPQSPLLRWSRARAVVSSQGSLKSKGGGRGSLEGQGEGGLEDRGQGLGSRARAVVEGSLEGGGRGSLEGEGKGGGRG